MSSNHKQNASDSGLSIPRLQFIFKEGEENQREGVSGSRMEGDQREGREGDENQRESSESRPEESRREGADRRGERNRRVGSESRTARCQRDDPENGIGTENNRTTPGDQNGIDSSSSSDDEDFHWGEGNQERGGDWLEHSDCSCSDAEAGTPKHPFQTPKVLELPKPKHCWFVVKEVLNRELGDFKVPVSFTKRFYGSLHAVQRLELMYKLKMHNGCVNAINFSKDGTRLISGSDDKMVGVWNWAEGRCLSTFDTGHSSNVFQCKFLPIVGDNGHIVTCSRDGMVRLALQTANGEYLTDSVLAIHSRPCHKLSVIHQEPYIVISAGADAQLFSIDIREKRPKRLMFVKEKIKKVALYSVHVNPLNSNEFCVSGEDYFIRVYDRRYIQRNGQAAIKFFPQHLSEPESVYVTCAVYNYNGTEILGSYNDDDIYLFDRNLGSGSNYVHKYEGHRNSETVKGVNFFGPKSEYIVSGSDCGYFYIWDKHTESIVQWKRADEEGVVNCLEPHPKIPVLATSGLDSDVKIWVPSCEQEPTMEGLEKVVKLNRKKRVCRNTSSRDSLNDTLVRWWRQIRYLNRRQEFRDNQPIFIQIGALGSFGRGDLIYTSSSQSSSSSSSSSYSEMSD